jgi:hypothetical protein
MRNIKKAKEDIDWIIKKFIFLKKILVQKII